MIEIVALRPALIEDIDYQEPELRKTIWGKRHRIWWQRSLICPCKRVMSVMGISQATNEFRGDCPECKGRGVIYDEGQEAICVVGDLRFDPKLSELYGMMGPGSAVMTFVPEHTPAYLDRLTMIDGRMIYQETVKHTGTVVSLRYPVYVASLTIGELDDNDSPTIPGTLEIGVTYCRVAPGGVIAAGEKVEGTDFKITENGEVDWTLSGDDAPNEGDFVSYRYHIHPTFVVDDFPHSVIMTRLSELRPQAIMTEVHTSVLAKLEFLRP